MLHGWPKWYNDPHLTQSIRYANGGLFHQSPQNTPKWNGAILHRALMLVHYTLGVGCAAWEIQEGGNALIKWLWSLRNKDLHEFYSWDWFRYNGQGSPPPKWPCPKGPYAKASHTNMELEIMLGELPTSNKVNLCRDSMGDASVR
jgi:hypothetical protein